ncbi:MAG: YihY family inner membrane protein [Gammaproteobacteria bacterium]
MLNLSTSKINFTHYAQFIWRRLGEDRCWQMASALTLTTLLSIVPLLTIIFSILGALPAFRDQAQEMINYILLHFLPTSAGVVQMYLKQFTSKAAELTGLGGLILIVTSLILIANIEQALNTIWRVPFARKGFAALVIYWSILTLTPLVVLIIIAITSYFSVLHVFFEIELVSGNLFRVFPFIGSVVAFTLLYFAVPNCKVPLGHAFVGGLVAGILFEAGRLAFRWYITHFPNYQLLYGALATLPILSLWIYLSWSFILFGAEITHGMRYYDRKSIEKVPHFLIAYRWLAFLWEAQHQERGLTLLQLLQKQPLSSMHEAEQIIEHLQQHNWIWQTAKGEYVLARDMHEVNILDLYRNLKYPLPSVADLHIQVNSEVPTFSGDKLLLETLTHWENALQNSPLPTLAQCYEIKT